ncbi:MAG TPA: cysteine-rich CWC family protein [Roseateles sp.]
MSGVPLAAICPRCGGGFECGAASGPAGHCDCFGIRLSEPLRAQLVHDYPGQCLCLRCLRELIAADDQRPAEAAKA